MKHLLSIIAIVLLFASCDKKKTSTNTNSASSVYVEFKINGQYKKLSPDAVAGINLVMYDYNGSSGDRTLMITDVPSNSVMAIGEFENYATKGTSNGSSEVKGGCLITISKNSTGTYDGTFSATFLDSTFITEGAFHNIPKY